jgi:N-acetylmuramoyl-L-alanine amidase
MDLLRGTAAFTIAILVLAPATLLVRAQGSPPATPLTLITREGRRPVPTTLLSGQELIALDDVATLFQVSVMEDALTGGVTVSYRGRTIVASADQPMASVNGRVVSLPSPIVRSGRRWLVPIEFLPRAVAPIYDQRIDLRRASRMLIVGDLMVPRITARFDAVGPPTRATIDISPAAPVAITVDQGRIILRVEADALDLALPGAGNGLIEQIRAGDQQNTVTVLLAGTAGAARAAATTADNVTRVAVEVPGAGGVPDDSAAAPPPPAPPAGEGLALTPRRGFQTVVIDPGHGGDDVGVRGAGGTEEKQLTLDVARRLRQRIETRLGLRVVLTRDEDRTAALDERAATANNSKADLFISLHFNGALAAGVSGAEVFHLRLDDEGEDARRDAAAEALTLPVLGGGRRTIEVVRWDLAQAAHVDASTVLAGLLEEELRRRVPMSPRPVQQGPMRVLTGAAMPAALVELAYLTNPGQAAQAQKDDFKNAVAEALYDAIVRFRSYAEGQQAR